MYMYYLAVDGDLINRPNLNQTYPKPIFNNYQYILQGVRMR